MGTKLSKNKDQKIEINQVNEGETNQVNVEETNKSQDKKDTSEVVTDTDKKDNEEKIREKWRKQYANNLINRRVEFYKSLYKLMKEIEISNEAISDLKLPRELRTIIQTYMDFKKEEKIIVQEWLKVFSSLCAQIRLLWLIFKDKKIVKQVDNRHSQFNDRNVIGKTGMYGFCINTRHEDFEDIVFNRFEECQVPILNSILLATSLYENTHYSDSDLTTPGEQTGGSNLCVSNGTKSLIYTPLSVNPIPWWNSECMSFDNGNYCLYAYIPHDLKKDCPVCERLGNINCKV